MKTTQPNHTLNELLAPPADDAFGFHGTIRHIVDNDQKQADKAWAAAMQICRADLTNGDAQTARAFLRSRFGRHIADATTFHAKHPMRTRLKTVLHQPWVKSRLHEFIAAGGAVDF